MNDQEAFSRVVDELAALVRQLVHQLGKVAPDSDLPAKALDYLKRKCLQGSPLRNDTLQAHLTWWCWHGRGSAFP